MYLHLRQYNLIAAGFYDGMMLYSQALNETLSQQRTGPGPVKRPKGDVVTKKMWNKTVPGDSSLVFNINILYILLLFFFFLVAVLDTFCGHAGNVQPVLDPTEQSVG